MDNGVENYSFENLQRDWKLACLHFPFYVAMWFGTTSDDQLVDPVSISAILLGSWIWSVGHPKYQKSNTLERQHSSVLSNVLRTFLAASCLALSTRSSVTMPTQCSRAFRTNRCVLTLTFTLILTLTLTVTQTRAVYSG